MGKKILILAGVVIAVMVSAVMIFGGGDKDSFTVKVICESNGISMIFYSSYINGEHFDDGGMADSQGNELTSESTLEVVKTKSYMEGNDIAGFSMDFSLYGKNDTSEIGTTNRVDIPAEYGQTYTIVLRGDKDSGFTAELQ
jgi:hypothetical protein